MSSKKTNLKKQIENAEQPKSEPNTQQQTKETDFNMTELEELSGTLKATTSQPNKFEVDDEELSKSEDLQSMFNEMVDEYNSAIGVASSLVKAASHMSKQATVEESTSSTEINQAAEAIPATPASPPYDGNQAITKVDTMNLSSVGGEDKSGDEEVIKKRASTIRSVMGSDRTDHDDEDKIDQEVLANSGFTKGEIKFLRNVIKCCIAENGFDIYQLMAFDGTSDARNGCKDWIKYMFNIIKSVLCALTQIFGIIIIMIDFVKTGLETKEFCNPPEYDPEDWLGTVYDSNLKILAFLFSSFLAYFSVDTLMGVEQGMYKKMKHAWSIKWINGVWLRIGFGINVFVAIIAVYGSFVVIFFSDNSLDMVLNSVALFFIVELDDLLVKQSDYERILKHIDKYQHEPKKNLKDKRCGKIRHCCSCCCHKILSCLSWIYTLPFQIIRYGTVLLCLFIPFFLGYCY